MTLYDRERLKEAESGHPRAPSRNGWFSIAPPKNLNEQKKGAGNKGERKKPREEKRGKEWQKRTGGLRGYAGEEIDGP